MSGIKAKNSRPEMLVRRLLFAAGYRFRLHRQDLPGTPDIVMPGRKVIIFVHGCFWHSHEGCRYARMPATRQDFWEAKLRANVDRDRRSMEKLNMMGWRVLYVWECATRNFKTMSVLPDSLKSWIDGDAKFGEISGSMPH